MVFAILGFAAVVILYLLSRNKPTLFKKLITFVIFGLSAVIALRFGNVILAALAVVFPLFFKSLIFLLRNFSMFKYLLRNLFRKKENRVMNKEKAYDILGLKPGASKAEIKKQYKEMMKKIHPDVGGSKYLSNIVNEAKDTLLK